MIDALLYAAATALGVLCVVAVLAVTERRPERGVPPVSRRALRELENRMDAERVANPGRQS